MSQNAPAVPSSHPGAAGSRCSGTGLRKGAACNEATHVANRSWALGRAPATRARMGSGPADAFPVRLEPELRQALDERAAQDETTASDTLQREGRTLQGPERPRQRR